MRESVCFSQVQVLVCMCATRQVLASPSIFFYSVFFFFHAWSLTEPGSCILSILARESTGSTCVCPEGLRLQAHTTTVSFYVVQAFFPLAEPSLQPSVALSRTWLGKTGGI